MLAYFVYKDGTPLASWNNFYPCLKLTFKMICLARISSLGGYFSFDIGSAGLLGWCFFSVYILSRWWASSLHIASCLWTVLKSSNHSYLCPSGFEVTFSKGNSELNLENCIWERMKKEIKKEGGSQEGAGGGEEGKWAGANWKGEAEMETKWASFMLRKSHQDSLHWIPLLL